MPRGGLLAGRLLETNVLLLHVNMQRKALVLAVAASCAVVGLVTWFVLESQSKVQYRTATVSHGDINVTISATGNPNAVVTVNVGSQVSGIMLALFADFNSKVTKGELIARIDPAPFQARVDQAQANVGTARAAVTNAEAVVIQALAGIQAANSALAAAEANVVKAQAITADAKVKVDRRVIMVKQGADSKEDLETAQTTYQSAIADHSALVAQQHAVEDSVKVAQAELNVAKAVLNANQEQVKQFTAALLSTQIDLGHTNIKAPVDGVVVSRNVDVGANRRRKPGRSDSVSDCPGHDQDAARYERVGSRCRPRTRGPEWDIQRGRLSRPSVQRNRDRHA